MKKQMPLDQEAHERVDEIDGRTGFDIDITPDDRQQAIHGQSRLDSCECSSPSYENQDAPIFLG